MDNEIIGIAKRDIKAGEVIAEINGLTGEVTSDNLEFVEGGRARLFSWVGGYGSKIVEDKILKGKIIHNASKNI